VSGRPLKLELTEDDRQALAVELNSRGKRPVKLDRGLFGRLMIEHQRLLTRLVEE
jgi:hypothetical protein